MSVLTAVGNDGTVYLLKKLDNYNAASLVKSYGKILPKLQQAQTPKEYAETMNAFLEEAVRHGVQFITRGPGVF